MKVSFQFSYYYICSKNESAPLMAKITTVQSLSDTSHLKEYLDVLQICPAFTNHD